MIVAQPMFTYTVLYTYSLYHICNVTALLKPSALQWLVCWTAYPEVLGSNPVKSKNNFASVMLTEIIS